MSYVIYARSTPFTRTRALIVYVRLLINDNKKTKKSVSIDTRREIIRFGECSVRASEIYVSAKYSKTIVRRRDSAVENPLPPIVRSRKEIIPFNLRTTKRVRVGVMFVIFNNAP